MVIAQTFGMSETLVGLTVVAIGTSLPELATSTVAAWKGNSDIALGNVLGSNIFNIYFVLGVTANSAPPAVPRREQRGPCRHDRGEPGAVRGDHPGSEAGDRPLGASGLVACYLAYLAAGLARMQ